MFMKKAKIEGHIIDILEDKEIFNTNPEMNNKVGVIDNDIIYPLRASTDNRPGLYKRNKFYCVLKDPNKEELHEYKCSDQNLIDFGNAKNIQEVISSQNKLRTMKNSLLTSDGNITRPVIQNDDKPEMVGLKQAIIDKRIDLDKYGDRFGGNYNNDRRLLDKPSITLSKLIAFGNALDMEISLTFKDKNPNVPNPIGREITVVVTDDIPEE